MLLDILLKKNKLKEIQDLLDKEKLLDYLNI